MKIKLPRGLRDIEPEEYSKLRYVYEKFEETALTYGFSLMEPSTIEFFEVLAKKSGPQIRDEIYAFKDKAGREIALRFDLTVGLTRYVVSNPQIPRPVKLAAFSVMWRYDEPQYARYRSFYQWDAEVFGGNQVLAGGEIMAFSNDLLLNLGLREIEIRVSSRKLLEEVIKKYAPEADPHELMRIIDKRDKVGINGVKNMLTEQISEETKVESLLKIISIKSEVNSVEEAFREVDPSIAESKSLEDVLKTVDSARSLGVRNILIDLGIVRGLDYYDSVVFEVLCKPALDVGSLVGGGSFTPLVKALGGELTAFGAAGGVERTILAMEKMKIRVRRLREKRAFVAYTSNTVLSQALRVTSLLRRRGIDSEIDLTGRRFDKQLRYAEKKNYRFVVIVGEREAREGKIVLKDYLTGEQVKLTMDGLIKRLS